MSTAFSAIITAAALVLPDTSVGIAEQSITRSPGTPCTRRRASTTAIASLAHAAGAAGVEDGRALVAAELQQRGVVAGLRAGLDLALHVGLHRRRRGNGARRLHRRHRGAAVEFGGQVVGLHRRRLEAGRRCGCGCGRATRAATGTPTS